MKKSPQAYCHGSENHFHKYHALGNDYIVINPANWRAELSAKLIQTLCDRNTGIGADGILLGPCGKGKNPFVRVFNSDGSEAARSGNGLRIFAAFLRDTGLQAGGKFTVESGSGATPVELLEGGGAPSAQTPGEP